jgi:hypothetical protein
MHRRVHRVTVNSAAAAVDQMVLRGAIGLSVVMANGASVAIGMAVDRVPMARQIDRVAIRINPSKRI